MAITTTDRYDSNCIKLATLYVGRVVQVRNYVATRNHSDTLDYTDMRSTDVTEALVYVGRTGPKYSYSRLDAISGAEEWCTWHDDCKAHPALGRECLKSRNREEVVDLEIQDRFVWVDCTNLFVWRGEPHRTPEVDAVMGGELAEDFAAWNEYHAEQARIAAKKAAEYAAAEKARKEEEERNRPVVGKQMVVVKGRKVPKGTTGTVAFIHSNGGVLLKDDAVWRDRKAQGIWVNAGNLAAR
jgi:hypothetical protein